jgi:hypothetical protein
MISCCEEYSQAAVADLCEQIEQLRELVLATDPSALRAADRQAIQATLELMGRILEQSAV